MPNEAREGACGMADVFDPSDEGMHVWVSTQHNVEARNSPGMRVPATLVDGLLASLRAAAVSRANYCLNVAVLKWENQPHDEPWMIGRVTFDGVADMLDRASEAFRVLAEVAVEPFDDDEDGEDGEPDPQPDPTGSESA